MNTPQTPDAGQREAIRHFTGPCLTLAGPGSGKTFLLTHRVLALIRERGVPPERILVITFTKDAALSMRRRFEELSGMPGRVTFATFHSAFLQFLKQSCLHFSQEDILMGKRKQNMLLSCIHRAGISEDNREFLGKLEGSISRFLNIGSFPSELPGVLSEERLRAVIKDYAKSKDRMHVLDFDDMILRTKRLFEENPKELMKWQRRFSFFLVDEAQDMNPPQYEILRLLAQPQRNLFLVGDEDQSIYGFRGSSPALLLHFPKDYPEAKICRLPNNYRSGRAIVSAASRLICQNKLRFEKEICPAAKEQGFIRYVESKNTVEEAKTVLSLVKSLKDLGIPPEEIAILYRNRQQAAFLFTLFGLKKIPVNSKDMEGGFFSHAVFQDFEAYLSLAAGKRERDLFLRILNRPNRDLGRIGLEGTRVSFAQWERALSGLPDEREVKKLERHITQWSIYLHMRRFPFCEKAWVMTTSLLLQQSGKVCKKRSFLKSRTLLTRLRTDTGGTRIFLRIMRYGRKRQNKINPRKESECTHSTGQRVWNMRRLFSLASARA